MTTVSAATRVGRVHLWMKRHAISLYAAILTMLLALGAMAPEILVVVPSGSVGVLWLRFFGGTVTDRVYAEGLHAIFPWDRMFIYNTRMENDTKTYQAIAANGMMLSVEVAVR